MVARRLHSLTAHRFAPRVEVPTVNIKPPIAKPVVETGPIVINGQDAFTIDEDFGLFELQERLKSCPDGYAIHVYRCRGDQIENIAQVTKPADRPLDIFINKWGNPPNVSLSSQVCTFPHGTTARFEIVKFGEKPTIEAAVPPARDKHGSPYLLATPVPATVPKEQKPIPPVPAPAKSGLEKLSLGTESVTVPVDGNFAAELTEVFKSSKSRAEQLAQERGLATNRTNLAKILSLKISRNDIPVFDLANGGDYGITEFSAVATKPRSDGEFLIRFAKSGKLKEFPITAKSGDQIKCEIEYSHPGRKDILINGKKYFQLTDLSEDNLKRLKQLIAGVKAGSRVVIYQCNEDGTNQQEFICANGPNIGFGFGKRYDWSDDHYIALGDGRGGNIHEEYFNFAIEDINTSQAKASAGKKPETVSDGRVIATHTLSPLIEYESDIYSVKSFFESRPSMAAFLNFAQCNGYTGQGPIAVRVIHTHNGEKTITTIDRNDSKFSIEPNIGDSVVLEVIEKGSK